MGKGVVHVVEVDRGAELLILGASKEIQAAVRSQQRGGQGDQLFVWHKHEDIVEAMAGLLVSVTTSSEGLMGPCSA